MYARGSQLGPWVYEDFLIFSQNFEDSDFFEDFLIFTISPMLNIKRFFEIFWFFCDFLWFFGGCTKIFWVANPSIQPFAYYIIVTL